MLGCVQKLSCGPAEHEAAVAALLAGRTETLKEYKALTDELAQLHSTQIATQLPNAGDYPCFSSLKMEAARLDDSGVADPNMKTIRWLYDVGKLAYYHRAGAHLQFLIAIAKAFQEKRPDATVLLTADPGVALLPNHHHVPSSFYIYS